MSFMDVGFESVTDHPLHTTHLTLDSLLGGHEAHVLLTLFRWGYDALILLTLGRGQLLPTKLGEGLAVHVCW